MCISKRMLSTLCYPGRVLKKLADDQCSSITNGSTYHSNQVYIQLLTMGVDWPKIGCQMEVSIVFAICTYCIFTLYGRMGDENLLPLGCPMLTKVTDATKHVDFSAHIHTNPVFQHQITVPNWLHTLCPTSKLDVVSHTVDCVFQMSNHYNAHVFPWFRMLHTCLMIIHLKYAIFCVWHDVESRSWTEGA